VVVAENESNLIEALDISVKFGSYTALSGVFAEVGKGEAVTVIGPNGAGKTTLVRVMLGLIMPDKGRIVRHAGLRIGYMPQRLAVDATLPMTVRRFLSFACSSKNGREHNRLIATLEEVGAGHVLRSPLQEVSGGELQRVLLARALLRDPDLLVLDEPVRGVDIGGQADLYKLIGSIRDERKCGVLMVSHDLHLVMAATDRVICLNQKVQCAGHPAAVTQDRRYADLFGDSAIARAYAVYQHHPGHRHLPDGTLEPLETSTAASATDKVDAENG
jgi:zinc transport system ATP-binding protein